MRRGQGGAARAREERSEDRALAADVSDRKEVARLFRETIPPQGPRVLVNNAGIAGPTAKIEDIAPEEWDRCLAVDLTGQFICTRRAVPLLKSTSASIVNLCSVAGRLGYPMRTPYSAAKWAVVGFTKALAAKLGPDNIRVNAILPGIVAGERIDRVIEENKARARGIRSQGHAGRGALGRLDAHHGLAAADRRRDRVHLLDARADHLGPGHFGLRRHADAALRAAHN